jgi:hypothetical protein
LSKSEATDIANRVLMIEELQPAIATAVATPATRVFTSTSGAVGSPSSFSRT